MSNGWFWRYQQPFLVVLWMVCLFWLGQKPVHLDEANFLAMTTGDWWAPHRILINWEGVTQSAFDVLSNPPGVVWWLWPVREQSIGIQRLWMLPWVLSAVWGLGQFFQVLKVHSSVFWLVLCSPLFGLSSNSLMPEMPLFCCIVLGWQGLLKRERIVGWSLVLGAASLFRYSGLSMIPLLWMWLWIVRPKGWQLSIVAVCIPTLFLVLHDLQVYGQWHFLHMIQFQQAQQSWSAVTHKGMAFGSMVFLGAGVIPTVKQRDMLVLGVVVLSIVGLVYYFEFSLSLLAWISVPIGVYSIVIGGRRAWNSRQWWLFFWIVGGALFLLNLRFAATRYWIPFALPLFVVWGERKVASGWRLLFAVLSVHLVWDDAQLAKSQQELAKRSVAYCMEKFGERGLFAGHWGWQYVLEAENWKSVEDGLIIPNNVCFSYSDVSWSQEVDLRCIDETQIWEVKYRNWFMPLRVHTIEGQANYHSFMISNHPPIQTMTPFGWGYDPWDRVHFFRSCRD